MSKYPSVNEYAGVVRKKGSCNLANCVNSEGGQHSKREAMGQLTNVHKPHLDMGLHLDTPAQRGPKSYQQNIPLSITGSGLSFNLSPFSQWEKRFPF